MARSLGADGELPQHNAPRKEEATLVWATRERFCEGCLAVGRALVAGQLCVTTRIFDLMGPQWT